MRHAHIALGALLGSLVLAASPAAQEEGPLSLTDIEKKVAAIRQDDVAWRKIPWKTCILGGLAAAQREDKPIMFWCHIDRPVDDTRC
jgi:hypothetical protein